ncbi:MAG: restriction endonuclease [Nitrososphaerota archaeon]|nr:restriction endonuclease [Nitrososphaerota archaeon]
MSWKEFEAFVESAFEAFGYATERNLRFRKPRAEIDLVCTRDGLAFSIDCKHWKRTVGHSSMLGISERQLKRCSRLAERVGIERVIPLVVTLREEALRILENGVAVVPIHRLSDFILNWEEASDQIRVIEPVESQLTL